MVPQAGALKTPACAHERVAYQHRLERHVPVGKPIAEEVTAPWAHCAVVTEGFAEPGAGCGWV